MGKEVVRLGGVQETLLIPLYGRALDARARHPVLGDARAAELVERIDYGFTKFRGPSLSGSVLRTAIFDEWIRRFLGEHPAATVVELGSGLNTRSDRLDNGRARWFDLDLPDTIALRRASFTDTERATMIAGSVLDTDWFDQVAASGGPYFFVSEAVLLYLNEAQVRTSVRQIARRFPGSLLAFDTSGRTMIDNQDRNPVFKALSARMRWVCDDPRELEPCGLSLLDSRTFASPQPELARDWPLRYRIGMPLLARLLPRIINTYKLNLFAVGPAPALG